MFQHPLKAKEGVNWHLEVIRDCGYPDLCLTNGDAKVRLCDDDLDDVGYWREIGELWAAAPEMAERIGKQRAVIAELVAAVERARVTIEEYDHQRNLLLAALEKVEWVAEADPFMSEPDPHPELAQYCPACDGVKGFRGHHENCTTQCALATAKGEE